MKLYDILKTSKNIKNKDIFKREYRVKRNSDSSGAYAAVYLKKNDPHQVIKTSIKPVDMTYYGKKRPANHADLGYDGYYHYIKLLIESRIYEKNPFFPRIYNVHEKIDERGLSFFNFEMEKLIEFNKEPAPLIWNYFTQIADMEQSGLDEKYFMEDRIYWENAARLLRLIRGNSLLIKNQMLKNAISFIIENKNNFNLDIGQANIMWRRGKYGLQLVITDPYGSTID
jgi:hypothetical protein